MLLQAAASFPCYREKKKIWVEGVKKNRPQTEKTSAFKSAGSDQFHIGPCRLSKAGEKTRN